MFGIIGGKNIIFYEAFKIGKGPTDKAKEPDPGRSDQQNFGFKKLKNRKTDRAVGLNFCISNISSGTVSFSVPIFRPVRSVFLFFSFFCNFLTSTDTA